MSNESQNSLTWLRNSCSRSYLQYEEAGMEDAGVDENCTKLATLEQLIGFLEEEVVGVEHNHPVVVHQAPRIEFVES